MTDGLPEKDRVGRTLSALLVLAAGLAVLAVFVVPAAVMRWAVNR